jgi:hypothetical protein
VQPRNDAVHLVVDVSALGDRQAGQRLLPEDAALDVLHEVEGAADHALVLHQQEGPWHRDALGGERPHDVELAFDCMRGRQQLGRRPRLAAHHIARRRGGQQVGRVGLAALELLRRQRSAELGQVLFEVRRQSFDVEAVPRCDFAKLTHPLPPPLREERSFMY